MEVIFETKARREGLEMLQRGEKVRSKGKVHFNLFNHKPTTFENGLCRTTDKEEIQRLLHSRLFEDGTIELVTDPELVNGYLEGDEPDKLSDEVLLGIDDEGLRKIAKILGIPEHKHKNYPGMLRAILKNKNITNAIRHVMLEHKLEDTDEDILAKAQEAGVIYRNGPWYKFMKGDEQISDKDLSIGKNELKVQEWLANPENKEKVKAKL